MFSLMLMQAMGPVADTIESLRAFITGGCLCCRARLLGYSVLSGAAGRSIHRWMVPGPAPAGFRSNPTPCTCTSHLRPAALPHPLPLSQPRTRLLPRATTAGTTIRCQSAQWVRRIRRRC